MVLSYSDDKNGAQSYEHVFDTAIYFEDFESVELGPNQDEGLASDRGAVRARRLGSRHSGVRVGDPDNDGVTEWAGWSFADKEWWTAAAGGQRREEYSLGSGTVLVADPDDGMIGLMRILKKTDGMKPTSPARPFRWMGLPRELPFCSLPPAGVRNTTATTAKRQD